MSDREESDTVTERQDGSENPASSEKSSARKTSITDRFLVAKDEQRKREEERRSNLKSLNSLGDFCAVKNSCSNRQLN